MTPVALLPRETFYPLANTQISTNVNKLLVRREPAKQECRSSIAESEGWQFIVLWRYFPLFRVLKLLVCEVDAKPVTPNKIKTVEKK